MTRGQLSTRNSIAPGGRRQRGSSHGNVIGLLLQHIETRFAFEHACPIRHPDVLRVTFDGTALRWDAEFTLADLDTFATQVATALAPAK